MNEITGKNITTLTSRVAAVEFKMLHLQFRKKKIFEDQKALSGLEFKSNREKIRGMKDAVYNLIDMLVAMEQLHQLVCDIFATPELRVKFNQDLYVILNRTKKSTEKWKPVRNKLGGHIDIDVVVQFCEHHNYRGVFISPDLETDLSVLNMLLIESAVNSVRNVSDVFGRDLDVKKNGLSSELKLLVDKLNDDWNTAFGYFEPMMQFLYSVGKEEKLKSSSVGEFKGIVFGD